jgi:hypothetical protein
MSLGNLLTLFFALFKAYRSNNKIDTNVIGNINKCAIFLATV